MFDYHVALCKIETLSKWDALVSRGVLLLDSAEWISTMKKLHVLVKVRQVWLNGARLTVEQSCELMYLHELVGRGMFMTDDDVNEEIAKRTRTPPDYAGSNFHVTAREWVTAELLRTGKVKPPISKEEFYSTLSMRIVNGSTSKLPNQYGDMVHGDWSVTKAESRFQGKKRIRAEFISSFAEKEATESKSFISRAFLKFEVAKNRWLFPAQFHWIVKSMMIFGHAEKAFLSMHGIDHDIRFRPLL